MRRLKDKKIIYLLSFKELPKQGFIGETNKLDLSVRLAQHKYQSNNGKNIKCRWLKKYLALGYTLRIENIIRCNYIDSIIEETKAIKIYKKKGWKLYNPNDGSTGKKHSIKTKQLLSKLQKKYHATKT